MNYALDIRKHNIQPHLDIEKEIEGRKNGLYTFILRINNGNIVDCSWVEYVNAKNYLVLKKVELQEIIIKL
jgi:hypothetical protein